MRRRSSGGIQSARRSNTKAKIGDINRPKLMPEDIKKLQETREVASDRR
jgi:hypothetical protein